MRRILVAAALAAAAAALPGSRPAAALPYTAAFDILRSGLEYRRDNNFGGTLDKTQKKQRSAVLKSIALLDRDASDLGDDVKTAVSIASLLQKAYATDFSTMSVIPEALPSLPAAMDLTLEALQTQVVSAIDLLSSRLPGLTPKAALAVQKTIDAANAAVAASADTRAAWAKNLLKAWKQVAKGNRLADKGQASGGAQSMTFTIDAGPYTASVVTADVFSGDGGLQVSGIYNLPGGGFLNVYATVIGVTSTGTFPLSGTSAAAQYQFFHADLSSETWNLNSGSGSVVIDHYDAVGKRITGHFDFTATGGLSSTTVTVHADFVVTDNITVNPGTTPF